MISLDEIMSASYGRAVVFLGAGKGSGNRLEIEESESSVRCSESGSIKRQMIFEDVSFASIVASTRGGFRFSQTRWRGRNPPDLPRLTRTSFVHSLAHAGALPRSHRCLHREVVRIRRPRARLRPILHPRFLRTTRSRKTRRPRPGKRVQRLHLRAPRRSQKTRRHHRPQLDRPLQIGPLRLRVETGRQSPP